MALEELGMYARSLSQYEQEPFDLTFNVDSLPTAGDVAMLPVKMSLGYNLMRSAWWGSKAIGMNPFSRLTNPFNPAHLQWRYRAKSMKGLSAKILEGVGSKTGGLFKWTSGKGIESTEQAIPWYRRAVYSMEKDNALLKDIAEGKGAPASVKSMGLGALDRYLLRPQEMHNRMAKVHSAFRTAVTADELGEMMLSNLYEASALRGSKGQTIAKVGKFAAKTAQEVDDILTSDTYKFMKFRGMDQFNILDAAEPNIHARTKLAGKTLEDLMHNFGIDTFDYERGFVDKGRKNFLKISRRSNVTLFDILSGKGGGFEKKAGEGFFQSRWRYAKETVSFGYDDGTRRKLSLYHSRGRATRKLYQQYMLAESKTYQQIAAKAAKQASGDIVQQFKAYSGFMDSIESAKLSMERGFFVTRKRAAMARALKTFGGIGVGLTAGAWLTKSVVQGMFSIPGRIAATSREFMRPEFGSGNVLQNARVSTERQRAVQAIQNAHMNARYLLGNEAVMYH